MMQEPRKVIPPLTKAEQKACDAIHSLGGGVSFHPESPDFVMDVHLDKPTICDEHLPLMEPLADRVDWLALGNSGITSAGLVYIGKLRNLWCLLLNDTPVDDDGLKYLTSLKRLKTLRLDGTRITGKTLGVLKDCPALAQLDVERTPVGLTELRALQDHPSLDRVDLFLSDEAETDPEWEKFWRNLPFVKAREAMIEEWRRRAEEGKKKHGGLPFTTGTQIVLVGDNGQETVIYSTEDEAEDEKEAGDSPRGGNEQRETN